MRLDHLIKSSTVREKCKNPQYCHDKGGVKVGIGNILKEVTLL